jgi:hypothetical protein
MITPEDEVLFRGMIKDELKDVEHKCTKEGPLATIAADNARIIKDYYGNGQEGTQKTILRIADKVDVLIGTTAGHTKVISDLLSFQTSHEGERKGKKEMEADELIAVNLKAQKRRDLYWRIATIVTILLSMVALYFKLK